MTPHALPLLLFLLCGSLACQPARAQDSGLDVRQLGGGHALIRVERQARTLLLPIEESAPPVQVDVLLGHHLLRTLDVRLARTRADHYVPFALDTLGTEALALATHGLEPGALCWRELRLTDEPFRPGEERYRPACHFAPPHGWMNDPNGMVWHQGEYHLFYQHNPYGSQWGNMHWGHATSPDMIHWTHRPVALAPDALGTIYSGSAVVDTDNTAGFGPGAIVAFYTSAGHRQTQSLAYSTDGGRTFCKYARNPILTSPDQHDFRDPKVIWHQPTRRWVMVLAVGRELRFYASPNLKEWRHLSSYGRGRGAHGGVWECPDLFCLPVEGEDTRKWVLVCNINPGGPQGGSATQYFVGDFDGTRFTEQDSTLTLWMDWGKDHYATVSFSNHPQGHTDVLAWMSNWEYAAQVPTTAFRSACSLPRRLSLCRARDGSLRLLVRPVPQTQALRREGAVCRIQADTTHTMALPQSDACEILVEFRPGKARTLGLRLHNELGEEVEMGFDLDREEFFFDRTRSGLTDFSPSFATRTAAPLLPAGKRGGGPVTLRLLIDRCSIEAFANDGQAALTHLVFPTKPYSHATFHTPGAPFRATVTCHALSPAPPAQP